MLLMIKIFDLETYHLFFGRVVFFGKRLMDVLLLGHLSFDDLTE